MQGALAMGLCAEAVVEPALGRKRAMDTMLTRLLPLAPLRPAYGFFVIAWRAGAPPSSAAPRGGRTI